MRDDVLEFARELVTLWTMGDTMSAESSLFFAVVVGPLLSEHPLHSVTAAAIAATKTFALSLIIVLLEDITDRR
jgi:hypothetical protein